MFRLLVILLALHFSIEVNGAPSTVLEENGENIIADNDINLTGSILGEENEKSKDSAFEEATRPSAEAEKIMDTPGAEPSLKRRHLRHGDSGSPAKESSSWTERLARKARNAKAAIAAKATKCTRSGNTDSSCWSKPGRRTKGRKRARVTPTDDLEEPTDGVETKPDQTEVSHPVDASHPVDTSASPVDSSSPRVKTPTPPVRPPPSPPVRCAKDAASKAVSAARKALAVPGADPARDDGLAAIMQVAIYQYNEAYGRPQLHLEGKSHEAQIKAIREEMEYIIGDEDARNEGIKRLEARLQAMSHARNSTGSKQGQKRGQN